MSPWTDYIRNNFWLKVFSLALALLIWMTVNTALKNDAGFSLLPWNKQVTRDFNPPVNLLILPEQGQGFTVNPTHVKVVVQGDPDALNSLPESRVLVFARLSGHNTTSGIVPLEARVPREFSVKMVEPETISVESTPNGFMFFPPAPLGN